ncbi:MAG TPA: hypothetical protein VFZ64_14750 [Nocardioidaceae bacterium]
MGIFDRFFSSPGQTPDPAAFDPTERDPAELGADPAWLPAQPAPVEPVRRVPCACTEHVEDLLGLYLPYTAEMAGELGDEPMTVGELIECGGLDVEAKEPDDLWLPPVGDQGHLDPATQEGPFEWTLWVGDEARAHYDDEADLQLDESLLQQPGLERVVWEDREVFHVGAGRMCRSGVLAAAARALADPRVRIR